MPDLDYYKVLRLPRTATREQIKRRYRMLAKAYHPDKNGDAQAMACLNAAYKVLSDPKERFKYDKKFSQTKVMARQPARAPKASRPVPRPQPEQHAHVKAEAPLPTAPIERFSLWKIWAIGSTVAVVALTVLVLRLGGQHPQLINTAKVSNKQSPATAPVQPTTTTTPTHSSDTSALSKQLAKENAQIKKEEARARKYMTQYQTDYKKAQRLSRQSLTPALTPVAQLVRVPNSSPFVYAGGFGQLEGTYYYAVSYVSSEGSETSLGPASIGVSPHRQGVYVSGIPDSSNTSVSQVKLYRTKAGGSMTGPYYLVATLPNGTTRYFDNTSDDHLPTWTAKG